MQINETNNNYFLFNLKSSIIIIGYNLLSEFANNLALTYQTPWIIEIEKYRYILNFKIQIMVIFFINLFCKLKEL